MTTLAEPPQTFAGYRASRNPDGSLTIFQVPIFVECSRNTMEFDTAWIAAAVAKAKQAEAEGYLPPLHVRHHDGDQNENVQAAGYFRVTGTGPITFKGTRRVAIFADLIVTDPSVQVDVLAKRLPYRSVEIFDVEQPAIDSLALLDHEAPYLELPMLMVTDIQDGTWKTSAGQVAFASATVRNPWDTKSATTTTDSPVVAFFRRGRSAHLFYTDTYKDTTMADTKAPKEEPVTKMADGAMIDIASVVKAIEDGTISIADMDSILAAITKQRAASAPAAEVEAPEAAPAAAPGAMAEAMAKGVMDVEMARLRGELDAQKARLNERDAQDRRRDDVSIAMKRLSGRPLGSDLEAKLVKFHRDHGPAAFAAYVDSMAQTFGALASDDQSLAAFADQNKDLPKTSMKYQSLGAAAIEKAALFAREYQDLHARGHVRMSEERYIELNMDRAGFKAQS